MKVQPASGPVNPGPLAGVKKQGDPDGARQNLQASRDILTNLIRLHGENPTWKTGLDLVKKELGE